MTEEDPAAPWNGMLGERVVIDTAPVEWQPSPSPSVWRKRLHRVGPAEAGQVTSVVQYMPDSEFPAHDHPEGEEILVLQGVFSDEHGDWPAGTYLLNPEGFRHAPFSKEGCLLFVKLRQAPGATRNHVAVRTDLMTWEPTEKSGIERKPLHVQPDFSDETYLESWAPGTDAGEVSYPDGVEFFVLEGELVDEEGRYERDHWLRLPSGTTHRPRAERGCLLYVKYAGIPGLRSA